MSYGTDVAQAYRECANYIGRILKGEKPADLPVMQLSKFDLLVNLKTAKTLHLTIPPNVLANASSTSPYLLFLQSGAPMTDQVPRAKAS